MTNDGTNTLTYDNNGNLTSDGTNTHTWDRANRLLSAGTHSYAYDGNGARIQKTVSSVVTDYFLDVQPGLTQVLRESDGTNTNHYIHSPRGIHAMNDGSNWSYMLQDGLGSVRAEIGANVAVNGSQSYAPYGEVFGVSGTMSSPFAFTGEPLDGNGLQYHRARYYMPEMGVWASLDPLETANRYGYVDGNPINGFDPTGMFNWETLTTEEGDCLYCIGRELGIIHNSASQQSIRDWLDAMIEHNQSDVFIGTASPGNPWLKPNKELVIVAPYSRVMNARNGAYGRYCYDGTCNRESATPSPTNIPTITNTPIPTSTPTAIFTPSATPTATIVPSPTDDVFDVGFDGDEFCNYLSRYANDPDLRVNPSDPDKARQRLARYLSHYHAITNLNYYLDSCPNMKCVVANSPQVSALIRQGGNPAGVAQLMNYQSYCSLNECFTQEEFNTFLGQCLGMDLSMDTRGTSGLQIAPNSQMNLSELGAITGYLQVYLALNEYRTTPSPENAQAALNGLWSISGGFIQARGECMANALGLMNSRPCAWLPITPTPIPLTLVPQQSSAVSTPQSFNSGC